MQRSVSGGFDFVPRWAFLAPGIDLSFRRSMARILHELKVYPETGQPAPAKARTLARNAVDSARRSTLDRWVLANGVLCATSGALIAANFRSISPHLGGLAPAVIAVSGAELIDYGLMLGIVGA